MEPKGQTYKAWLNRFVAARRAGVYLCRRCGKEQVPEGQAWCEACREYNRTHRRQTREERNAAERERRATFRAIMEREAQAELDAAGLTKCPRCRKLKDTYDGYSLCPECREYNRERARQRKALATETVSG